MEIGIENEIPTYSGGLGVLAGDAAHSFADLGFPAVFVTPLYKMGYATQELDVSSGQIDYDTPWDYRKLLKPLGIHVDVEINGSVQKVGAWQYLVSGKVDVPIVFLDTDVEGNNPAVRQITDRLYGGDHWHRLMQELVLGIGGYRILEAMGRRIEIYHLNESHAALLVVELMRQHGDIDEVRKRCVFTAHTPVPAGYDAFSLGMIKEAFKHYDWVKWEAETTPRGEIDLSRIAVKYSGVTNAVSLKHRYVSERILDHGKIEYVTNGVYHRRWVHGELKKLYDRHIPGWEETPALLTQALELPTDELQSAHQRAKSELLSMIRKATGTELSKEDFTLGLAKRVTAYKRNDLILSDLDRFVGIAEELGPIQVVLAGKTHPMDDVAKSVLRNILGKIQEVRLKTKEVKIVYLENYDMRTAKALVAGCDVWLNNPKRPLEACGTSGMKAAMNAVLNFSIYDGWWLEGGVEGVNGWGIGRRAPWGDLREDGDSDLQDLYRKLSGFILPTYYHEKERWWSMSKNSIATVGPVFNSYRMINEYEAKVYARARQLDDRVKGHQTLPRA